jgi:hypothetical protein
VALVKGDTSLNVKITEIPAAPEGAKLQAKVAGSYAEDGSLRVTIESGEIKGPEKPKRG